MSEKSEKKVSQEIRQQVVKAPPRIVLGQQEPKKAPPATTMKLKGGKGDKGKK